MKIKKVEIQAFRAYKSKEHGTFDLTIDGENPSNFVSIYAPNGFGKSSFYDAIEWGMTNNIARYLHEEIRKNNELAAKGTKKAGKPQFILRNRDADEDVLTSVHINTTLRAFNRDLKTARIGTSDFQFKESQTEPGSEPFRNVILSQDGIERFMREVTPQDRYKHFMEYFGGESEKYRKEITSLIVDNQNILDQLDKDKKGLEIELSQPFDDSVFEAFNKAAVQLGDLGEEVKLISKDISEKLEREATGQIVSRLNELKHSQVMRLSKRTFLEAQLLKLPEIHHISKEIPELIAKLKSLESTVKFSEDFEAHQQRTLIGRDNLNRRSLEFSELNSVGEAIPKYLSIKEELQATQNGLSRLIEKSISLNSDLAKNKSSLNAWLGQLNDLDKKILDNQSLDESIESLFLQISHAETNKLIFERILEAHDTSRSIELVAQQSAFSELKQLGEIEVDAETFFSTDISFLRLDHSDLNEIQQISNQIILLDAQLENIKLTRESLKSRVNKIESLILAGLDYLNNDSTSICPLCKTDHNTPDQLRATIEISDFNPEIDSLNKTFEELEVLKRQLQLQFNSLLERIKNKRSLRINELQNTLLNCSNTLSKLDDEVKHTNVELAKINQTLSSLKSQTSNLSHSELSNKLSEEIASLIKHKDTLNKQISIANKEIEGLSFQLVINESETTKRLTMQTDLEKQNEYQIVENFINKNAIDSKKIIEIHNAKTNDLRVEIDKITLDLKTAEEHLAELQQKIISENRGLNYRQLVELKEYSEKQLFDRNSELASFTEASKRALDADSFTVDEYAEKRFKNEIQSNDEHLKTIDNQLATYSLLRDHLEVIRPYVYRTKLTERLKEISKKLINHNSLRAKLEVELSKALDSIRSQINAFFYTDLINSIYSKIDPHPSFKKIDFTLDTTNPEKPGLNFVITDESGDHISPNLYFSAAQINILSLSVFLANALHAKDSNNEDLNVILMDDPIQAMDSINILSTIDLLRNLMVQFKKQIIVSTHDENFFELLKRKIPTEIFKSKFISLESYGMVKNSN